MAAQAKDILQMHGFTFEDQLSEEATVANGEALTTSTATVVAPAIASSSKGEDT